jgi:hypothetical protein
MYADMKTVREGDMLFIHTDQKIYGAFKATSEFCEDSTVPCYLQSKNVHYKPHPNQPNSGWQSCINEVPVVGYYRRISITHFENEQRENLCFMQGVNANEVFELKLRNHLWSIPERWKYEDKSRTICPLMEYEAIELLKIIERENSNNYRRRNITPADLSNYNPIEFVLDNRVVTNEKILEGWILANIGRHQVLDYAIGPFTCLGNKIPAGYIKLADIVGYQQLSMGLRKYKVIEIKKEPCVFPENIKQLLGYTDWVVRNIAGGDYKLAEGILVARSFDEDCKKFVENFNATARSIRLIGFDYVPPMYDRLDITRIV